MDKCFIVAGGDLRQLYAARLLAESARVYTVGFERSAVAYPGDVQACESLLAVPERADYIVLPIPASSDGETINAPYSGSNLMIKHLPLLVNPDAMVFGGKISADMRALFDRYGIKSTDITEREEFSVLNAVPTALSKEV